MQNRKIKLHVKLRLRQSCEDLICSYSIHLNEMGHLLRELCAACLYHT